MDGQELKRNYAEKNLNMMYVKDYSDKLDYYTPVLTTS